VTSTPILLPELPDAGPRWPDEVVDLTDRRRLLVRAVLGIDVGPEGADAVFAPADPAG